MKYNVIAAALIVVYTSAWEVFWRLGFAACFSGGDLIAFDHLYQILIQCLHAMVVAHLNGRIHLRHFAFANQIAYGAGANHDLVRGHAAVTIFGFAQGLGYHGLQRL